MPDLTQPPTTAATRRDRRPAGAVLAALALVLGATHAMAEPPAGDPAEAAQQRVLTTGEQAQIGAPLLFGHGFGTGGEVFLELTDLSAGEALRFWTFYDPNVVHKIPQWDLDAVRDQTPIPKDIGDRELQPYYDMLIYANRTAPAALDAAAIRENDLWSKVFHNPAKYRGEVLHFEGRLRKLRQYEPQAMAVQGGAREYYEAGLSVDPWDNDVVIIVFTELPDGLQVGDHLDVPVSFSGYFYKIFRYTAADTRETHKDRLAPLLIGHTVTLTGAPAPAPGPTEPEGSWPVWLGPLFFGAVGLTVALLFTLGYWFRSGDRHVHGRVSAARYGEFVPPPPDAPPDPRAAKRGRSEP